MDRLCFERVHQEHHEHLRLPERAWPHCEACYYQQASADPDHPWEYKFATDAYLNKVGSAKAQKALAEGRPVRKIGFSGPQFMRMYTMCAYVLAVKKPGAST